MEAKDFKVGDLVKHKWSDRKGTVAELEEGCNAIVRVDFNEEFVNWFVPSDLEILSNE